MKVYIKHNFAKFGGPKVVAENLFNGLSKLNVNVTSNLEEATHVACLQHPGMDYSNLPEDTLMGPNLFVLPPEAPELCQRFSNFVVPSDWVKDKYVKSSLLSNKNINIWSVGIDTNTWSPNGSVKKDLDCFIYFKNRTQQDISLVYKLCMYNKLKFEIIEYGSYKEEQLQTLCDRSKFCILLTNTESQGIAYMNILSKNIPCYVFNKPTWTYEQDKSISFDATSVPYFDNRCGLITKDLDLNHFKGFMNLVDKNHYKPREYVLENHTLELSAKKYVDLLRLCKK